MGRVGERWGRLLLRRYSGFYGGERLSGVLPAAPGAAPELEPVSDHVTFNMAPALASSRKGWSLISQTPVEVTVETLRAVTQGLSWRRTGWGEFSAPLGMAGVVSDLTLPTQESVPIPLFPDLGEFPTRFLCLESLILYTWIPETHLGDASRIF